MADDIDATWDAVMRRNSKTTGPGRLSQAKHLGNRERDRGGGDVDYRTHDPAPYVKLGQEACNTYYASHHPVLPDQCNDSSWMDFLQILVHQHAKTIVHLQELSTEVEKLKDFRSSFITSLTADLVKSSVAGPSDLHQSKDVWTSSPNKLIDSGFSTETKESANPKEEEDPLYSLLDLIQTKVSHSVSTSSASGGASAAAGSSATCSTCHHPHRVTNGTRESAVNLGKLDLVLGFKGGIGENVHIPRHVIGVILRELDLVELQRQLLFAVANVKTLEAQLSSFELEGSSPRLASKYLALSHENELLRFKLKEQEIQLEGTKARLRILERKSHQQAAPLLKLSLVPLESLQLGSTQPQLQSHSLSLHSSKPLPNDSESSNSNGSNFAKEQELIDHEALCGIGTGPNLNQDQQRVVVRSGPSRIPMRVVVCPPPPPPVQAQQSISSKSPGSSMSSKSSIPIAVTRLKRNSSVGKIDGKVGSNGKSKFWTWFATSSSTSGT